MAKYEKETRLSVAAPGQAAGNGLETDDSLQNCTTDLTMRQLKIAALLGCGRTAAIPLQQLVRVTGKDGRTVRLLIEKERRNGAPILSDCKSGYYLAADASEAEMFARSMRGRAREILKTARAIEVAAGID